MSSLKAVLPVPTQTSHRRETVERTRNFPFTRQLVVESRTAPSYGRRKGWAPKSAEDYGGGGAFPEIHIVQYPLGLGSKKGKATSNALPVQLDAHGKIKYDSIIRQGQSKDKIIYHKFQDLLPSEVTNEDDPELQKPSEEEVKETTEATRLALEELVQTKISAAMPIRAAKKPEAPQYVRYTPSQQGGAFNSGAGQRIVYISEIQKDPMEPPSFRTNKKIPSGPPSPPVPVMHSPPRKVTNKDQHAWRIPPCVSNWKNSKGYTIPLDMRVAADARGLQQTHINENFAKLAEALYIADRKAREGVEMRAQIEKRLAAKEKEKKEEQLRQLALKARQERAGIRPAAGADDMDEAARQRDDLRQERHKERQRERNINRAAPDKRSKLVNQRERDISEQIALGLPDTRNNSGELQFDQRLFNQSKGMDTGFGDDGDYNCYDKPWNASHLSAAQAVYKPRGNQDKDIYGEDLDKLIKTSRFVPDKEFAGTDRSARRDGPVAFEKDDDDPFGLDKFLNEAKKASKRVAHERDSETDRNKRRKR